MTFSEQLSQQNPDFLRDQLAACTAADVERALGTDKRDFSDIVALLSPAADPYIEEIAQESAAITELRFGKVIQLYTPLYLSNECVNQCLYCGFAHSNKIPRKTLTIDEISQEAQLLFDQGFRHILLVSGEDRKSVSLPYLLKIVKILHRLFDSIAIEIQPLSRDEYIQLESCGVDGLALYQETYDPSLYRAYHPAGPKSHYVNRLKAIESGGEAGFRSLGIGALLGLGDWRFEAAMMTLHGQYLAKRFWRSRVALSFPRIRGAAGSFVPPHSVSDRDLVHMMCALRIAMPDTEIILSTREPENFRDKLIGLAPTRMSAGSRTNPGGYSLEGNEGEQFEVVDPREPGDVAAAIAARGFEPVWKDFDRSFIR